MISRPLAWALLGRLNDAQAELEKATLLQPDDLEIRQLLVDLHWAVGHRDRARALAEVGGVQVPDGSAASSSIIPPLIASPAAGQCPSHGPRPIGAAPTVKGWRK